MKIFELFDLSGKTALVTGCNKGIGKAMAIGLAEAGANIIGVSANIPLSGSEIENEVTALGRSSTAYQCDFSNRPSLQNFIEKVLAENERINIVVNNAGMILRDPVAEHSDEVRDKVLAVKLDAR